MSWFVCRDIRIAGLFRTCSTAADPALHFFLLAVKCLSGIIGMRPPVLRLMYAAALSVRLHFNFYQTLLEGVEGAPSVFQFCDI